MKETYRQFCENESTLPIFSRDWWLDTVAGPEGWDVVTVEKGGEITAALPYSLTNKFGLTVLGQPPLTQCLGPWLKESKAKYAKQLGQQKDLMISLVENLPQYSHFSQKWHFSQTNWLPFHWQGFEQSTRYTYRLENLGDEQELWSNLQENIRREIKKARDRLGIFVRDDLGIKEFLELNKLVFSRQGRKLPYTEALVERIDRACEERMCRKIFIAEDKEGRLHAGVYIIWDDNSAYYLMGGGDPELRNSGATSLCMWEAIRFAGNHVNSFDFEGSMIEPIERFFRAFGAVQTPYSSIKKTPSRFLQSLFFLQKLKGG
ncbi:hypothetical protein imdm_492 [gamma proteobacterium IMCC2047]|nr:hypothetical protein imdm_492 [gamma proteobacterium IMCC2047]